MDRLTDFEILRKEHDILAKKLDRIDRQGQERFAQTLEENMAIARGLDRMEKLLEEIWGDI